MWEDARNKDGGRWLFVFQKNKGHPGANRQLDELWLEVVSTDLSIDLFS